MKKSSLHYIHHPRHAYEDEIRELSDELARLDDDALLLRAESEGVATGGGRDLIIERIVNEFDRAYRERWLRDMGFPFPATMNPEAWANIVETGAFFEVID